MSLVDNLEIEFTDLFYSLKNIFYFITLMKFTGIDLCDNILPFDGKFHIVPQLKSFQKLTEKDSGKIENAFVFQLFLLIDRFDFLQLPLQFERFLIRFQPDSLPVATGNGYAVPAFFPFSNPLICTWHTRYRLAAHLPVKRQGCSAIRQTFF